MTRESTDVDTAEQVIDSFRILAADKVRLAQIFMLSFLIFWFLLFFTVAISYIVIFNYLSCKYFSALYPGWRTETRASTRPSRVLHPENAALLRYVTGQRVLHPENTALLRYGITKQSVLHPENAALLRYGAKQRTESRECSLSQVGRVLHSSECSRYCARQSTAF